MLRLDGTYKIFRLQVNAIPASPTADTPERWIFPNFDHFGYPPGFQSSCTCWQVTGVHGTLDEEIAKDALTHARECHPGRKW